MRRLVPLILAVSAALALEPVRSQAIVQPKLVVPERQLLGVVLGRGQMEVLRRFHSPQEIQNVVLETGPEQLPSLAGSGPGGTSAGSPGYPGGGPFGGYPGGYPGGGSYPGGVSNFPPTGSGGEVVGQPQQGPEYSNAVLWVYRRPGNLRLEFLINEDGRVAQISAAAPTDKPLKSTPAALRTARGVTLGSTYAQVLGAYGNPERYRILPGGRFHELYFTKNYHVAFTLDRKTMRVARITIALAD